MQQAGTSHGREPLTATAHRLVREHLSAGDAAIDATVGNGHDIVHLASCVGPAGRVYGFDVQAEAIRNTRIALRTARMEYRALLFKQGHEHAGRCIPATAWSRARCAMINLGYLPGGNKSLATRAETTIPLLQTLVARLGRGSLITILCYPGHPGGSDECAAVEEWLRISVPPDWVTRYESVAPQKAVRPGPYLIAIRKG